MIRDFSFLVLGSWLPSEAGLKQLRAALPETKIKFSVRQMRREEKIWHV